LLQALLLSACSKLPDLKDQAWRDYPDFVELQEVPYYPQDPYQCGPQSLAMLLTYSGVATQPAALVASVYVPEKRGSFAAELKAAARQHGRLPYEIEPSLSALLQALADGYPVLILQNLGLGFAPVWHFAVTIGFDRTGDYFILRTGADQRRQMSTEKFLRRWRLGEYWAMVLLSPGDFPAWLHQDRYENQFALLENKWSDRLEAIYQRLQARWPGSTMAMLGLGNSAYHAGDLDKAADYYARTLNLDRDHVAAMHNLAQVRYDLGDYAGARDLICRARGLAQGHPLESYVNSLEQELLRKDKQFACGDKE
jgi:tetratricopeptide (TPR) repeat protein